LKEQEFRELLVRPPPLANKVHHAQRYFTTSPALSDQDGMVASGAMPLGVMFERRYYRAASLAAGRCRKTLHHSSGCSRRSKATAIAIWASFSVWHLRILTLPGTITKPLRRASFGQSA
jgi:hypothetical protein